MPDNSTARDIEEPLIHSEQNTAHHGEGDDGFGSSIGADIDVSDFGERLSGDVRLNQATAALAATIIGTL